MYTSLTLVLILFNQLKNNKINGIACLKALLISGILYLLCVQFADEKVAFSARNNVLYIYMCYLREGKPIALKKKKANVKSMVLSKKNGFNRGIGLSVNGHVLCIYVLLIYVCICTVSK